MNDAPKQTSTAAILSLVFGILGWTALPLLGALVAIICGHVARADIRRSRGQIDGDGLAIAGLVLGWASIAMVLLALMAVMLFFGGLAAVLALAGLSGTL